MAIYLASPGGVLLLLACLALSLHHNHNHSIRLGALLFAVGLITHITGLAQEIYYDHSCSSASPVSATSRPEGIIMMTRLAWCAHRD